MRRRAAELGFYAADFPEDVGGSGLPQLGIVLLRQAAPLTGCRLAGFTTYSPEGPTGLLLSGTDEQKKRYLVPLVTFPSFGERLRDGLETMYRAARGGRHSGT
ncbi:MAG: acyl-CoA dehydrogenase family protein [Actinomycetota bacterium]|nr:acyl-CoA dehydrogenase family protein [Actinomycetota bacterium]MDQ3954102.1 acyl-CoA dehydrogenase family protein [Actinomycetota bacterium]